MIKIQFKREINTLAGRAVRESACVEHDVPYLANLHPAPDGLDHDWLRDTQRLIATSRWCVFVSMVKPTQTFKIITVSVFCGPEMPGISLNDCADAAMAWDGEGYSLSVEGTEHPLKYKGD